MGPVTVESRGFGQLVRDRQFGPFLGAALLSNVGNWFHIVTSVIVVYELTGSATMVGLISFSNFAAFLFLTPLAGATADRFPRREVLLRAQSGSAIVAGALAVAFLSGHGSAAVVLGASLLLGIGSVFSIPATLTVVPELVRPADHAAAITLNTMSVNVARMIGPVLGAVVLAHYGAGLAFAVNSVTFLAYALVCRRLPRADSTDVVSSDGRYRVVLRLVVGRADLRALFGCVLLVGVLLEPNTTLVPVLVETAGGSDAMVGWVVGCFGAGALLAAPLARRPTLAGVPVVRVGFLLAAGGMVVTSMATQPVLLLVGFGLLGAGYLTAISSLTTEIQQALDPTLRGRVMALWSQVLLGVRPISSLTLGVVTDVSTVRVASLLVAVAAAAGAWIYGPVSSSPATRATSPS